MRAGQSGPTRIHQDRGGELILVGAGVCFPEQLTCEGLEALRRSQAILTIVPEKALNDLPSELLAKCTTLWHLYQQGRPRSENYRAVIDAVLERARVGDTISWLTPGHPLVFDSVSEGLRREAPTLGIAVQVLPAVSCIDTILADVGYEPANGVVIHEATAVVARDIALDPNLATILLQIGVFGTDMPRLTGREPLPELAPLRDHLLRFLPPEHEVAFVRSRWSAQSPGSVEWTSIDQMLMVPKQRVDGTTLFIPRTDRRGLVDPAMDKKRDEGRV